SFKNSSTLLTHCRIHTGELLPCTRCGKSFTTSSCFLQHQFIHSGAKPYTCPNCGKNVRYSSNLSQH
ncbi:ZN629 protein, partial [Ramphastos sulfuratus]|nr:ZN629 protein [Ramphastos sulfuratus]